MKAPRCVHATTVSIGGQGVLIRGKPGSGKSELALLLIYHVGVGVLHQPPAELVADDQTELYEEGGRLLARPPLALAALLEVRGLGIVTMPYRKSVPLKLVVDLAPAAEIARMPEPSSLETVIEGHRLPLLKLDPTRASAAARVRLRLHLLPGPGMQP